MVGSIELISRMEHGLNDDNWACVAGIAILALVVTNIVWAFALNATISNIMGH